MYDSETVRSRAIARLSKAKAWPAIPVEDFIRSMETMRLEMERLDYVALQSVALAIMSSPSGEWPIMSPFAFSRIVLPGLKEDFYKFSDTVQMEEQ